MSPTAVHDLQDALARLAHRRDNEAWAFLLDEVGGDIERIASRLTGDAALAQDVVQETLLQLRDHAGRFRPLGDDANTSARRWIMRVAANTSLVLLRKRKRARHHQQEAARRSQQEDRMRPDMNVERDEQARFIREALAELPESNRTAIVLHHIAGMGFPEVALELSCPLGTAKTHVHRGLERMRKYLGRFGVSLSLVALVGGLQNLPAATVPISAATKSALLSSPAKASSFSITATSLGASFVMKSAIAAAVVLAAATATNFIGAEQAPAGQAAKWAPPLAGLPSKPGPHIEKIKALGDNQWINLGHAAADPKWGEAGVRSWTCKMPYAQELGGAFISGQGPHGAIKEDGRYDDISFYDLYAHRWIVLYPGVQTKTFAADIKKGDIYFDAKQGWLMHKDGNAVHGFGAHVYQLTDYDSDRHMLYTKGWPNGMGGDQFCMGADWYKEGIAVIQQQMKEKGESLPAQDYVGTTYNVLTGKIGHEAGNGGHLFVPKKGIWTYWRGHNVFSNVGELNPKGPMPGVHYDSDFAACYDSKRERIYVGRVNHPTDPPWVGDFYIYDIKANEWTNPACKGAPMAYMPGTNSGMAHYDSANDRVVVFYNCEGPKAGVQVWDPETFTWEPQTDLPTDHPLITKTKSGFYCPELNVHILYFAVDGTPGEFYAYRYKNPAAAKSK